MAEKKIISMHVGPDNGIAKSIVDRLLPNGSDEVKATIEKYAMGNPCAARVLSERAKDFKTAKEVENLVGWPLEEHTLEGTGTIWDRFRPKDA